MSFDGRWQISIPTPMGSQDIILEIVDRDGGVSGTAISRDETVPFLDPVVEGDRIRWSQKITKPMSLTIKFDILRDGDLLSGKAKAGIFPSTSVTGSRA